MREKERNSREREQETQWITVNGRKPRNHHNQAVRTCFVNHLPASITITDLAKIFRTHGAIANISIPYNQKSPNLKFAFVQFKYPQSLVTAIRDENGRKVFGSRITAFPAKFDKPLSHIKPNSYHPQPTPKIHKNHNQDSAPRYVNLRDNRSYREVAYSNIPTHKKNQNQNQLHQYNLENREPNTKNTISKPHPSSQRMKSSNLLGEDTEQVRNSLDEIDLESEIAASIKGKQCEENVEWIQRSVIATTATSQSSEAIQEHILSEGVNCLTIQPMGGMQYIITFDSLEDKNSIIESGWLDRWFSSIEIINNQSAAKWRETWLSIYGVPLMAWGYDNFFKIGCIFGRVISVNHQRFDKAQVLIYTDCMFDINCKISMQIDDRSNIIHISEKQHQWGQNVGQLNMNKPNGKKKDHSTSQKVSGKNAAEDNDVMITEMHQTKSQATNDEEMIEPNNISEKCASESLLSPSIVKRSQDPLMNLGKSTEVLSQNSPSCQREFKQQQTKFYQQCQVSPSHCIPRVNSLNSPDRRSPSQNIQIISPNLNSPKQKNQTQNHPKPTHSPIQLTNKFELLLKNRNKTNSTSSSSLGSSSGSGPLFPPGFEHTIPAQHKIEKERKRKKKLAKKRRLKSLNHLNQATHSSPISDQGVKVIMVDDVIEMAEHMGLTFNGSEEELRKRIAVVLKDQKLNWETNCC